MVFRWRWLPAIVAVTAATINVKPLTPTMSLRVCLDDPRLLGTALAGDTWLPRGVGFAFRDG